MIDLSLFREAALKSVVLLGAAWIVTFALRKYSATLRHLVWVLAIVGVLILPFVQKVTPNFVAIPASVGTVSLAPVTPSSGVVLSSPEVAVSQVHQAGVRTGQSERRLFTVQHLPALLGILWLLGTIGVIGRFMLGLMATGRMARNAQPMLDYECLDEVAAIRAELGIRRAVEVRQSSSAPVPMIVGVIHQILMLPMTVNNWTLECRRAVLVHELAHVKRWDALTQLLGLLACALYWVNPFVWVAAKRLRVERELACDDIVLNMGCRASEYAGHLLQIAGALRRPLGVFASLPMARTSSIESRLRSILDASLSRNAISRNVVIGTFVMMLGTVIALAATSCSPRGEPIAVNARGAVVVAEGLHARTPRGTEVEFLGVTVPFDVTKIDKSKSYFGYPRKWWSADGRPIDLSKLEKEYRIEPAMVGSSGPAREVFFRLMRSHGAPVDMTPEFLNLHYDSWGVHNSDVANSEGRITQAVRIDFTTSSSASKPKSRFTARLGIADGPWEKVYTHRNMEYSQFANATDKGLSMLMGPTATVDGGIRFTIGHRTSTMGLACRLIALDKSGNVHVANQGCGTGYGQDGGMMTDFMFDHLTLSQVKYFQFQTRPFTWLEFKDIAFSPKE